MSSGELSQMCMFLEIIKQADRIHKTSGDVCGIVLIDEIGAGTDPDEGSALALAIIEKLLETPADAALLPRRDAAAKTRRKKRGLD